MSLSVCGAPLCSRGLPPQKNPDVKPGIADHTPAEVPDQDSGACLDLGLRPGQWRVLGPGSLTRTVVSYWVPGTVDVAADLQSKNSFSGELPACVCFLVLPLPAQVCVCVSSL